MQRDTGGHAVALRASMEHVFDAKCGETMLTCSDIGWVVGHSYIVYGPLLYGMTTIVYEGLPIRPDPGIWWKIVQDHGVTTMFIAPTTIRALRKQDPAYMREHDTSTLRNLFHAGEPLDEPTSSGISEALGVSVRDNRLADRDRLAHLEQLASRPRRLDGQGGGGRLSVLRVRREVDARGDRQGSGGG